MAIRTSAMLTSQTRVTTPDRARSGVIDAVFIDGYRGDQPGRTTVRFERGTVVMSDGSRKPKYWVTVPSTASWSVCDEPGGPLADEHRAEFAEGRAVADGITADVLSGDLFD